MKRLDNEKGNNVMNSTMNGRLLRTVLSVSVLFASGVSAAQAFDADTLALYLFSEGAAGSSLSTEAGAVKNAVDASKYAGTAMRKSGASLTYSDAAPGKYLFEGKSAAAPVASDYQSIWVDKRARVAIDGALTDDLFSAGESSVSYTVECFVREETEGTYRQVFTWLSLAKLDVCLTGSQLYNTLMYSLKSDGTTVDSTAANAIWTKNIYQYPCRMGWHHLAVVHDATTSKRYYYYDYRQVSSKDTVSTRVTEALDYPDLLIGAGYAQAGSTERSSVNERIAALRVSKRALEPSEFLYTSDEPDRPVPVTAFHFSMDGIAGASLSDPTQVVNRADTRDVAWKKGWVFSPVDGENGMFSSAIYKKRTVMSNGKIIGENLTSLKNWCLTKESGGAAMCGVSGIRFNESLATVPNQYGSFTLEGFVRFEGEGTEAKADKVEIFSRSGYPWWNDGKRSGSALSDQAESFCLFADIDANTLPSKTYYRANLWNVSEETTAGSSDCASSSWSWLGGDSWHHVAVVFDAKNLKQHLYIDYTNHWETAISNPVRGTKDNEPMRYTIGYTGDAGNRASFLGYYDEVRLSNAVLAPEDFLKFKSNVGLVLHLY